MHTPLLKEVKPDPEKRVSENMLAKAKATAKAKAKASQSVEGLLLSSFITKYVQSTDV